MAHDSDSKEYAGKGVAGSALGLGIAGTALALLNNNDGGLNLFGNRNHHGYHQGFAAPVAPIAPVAAPYAAYGGFSSAFETGYALQNERRIGCIEAELAGLKVGQVKDAKIALLEDELAKSQLLRYVDDKTCGVVRGQNLLNPNQIADPYMGQRMVIATHPPVVEFDRYRNREGYRDGCGCHDHDRWY